MENFRGNRYDGVDGFDNFSDDSNFLSAAGRGRSTARQAVKAAAKQQKQAARQANKATKVAARQERRTAVTQAAINRPTLKKAVASRIATRRPERGSPPPEVEISEEAVEIYTDPSATNVDLPNRDNEMPDMEAVREIASQDDDSQRGSDDDSESDDSSADGEDMLNVLGVDGFGDNTNADGDDSDADGDDNVDGFGENTNADGEDMLNAIDDDSFMSAAGKGRARRDAKKATKQDKRDANVSKKVARSSKIEAKGQAKVIRAEKRGEGGGGAKIAALAATVLGKDKQPQSEGLEAQTDLAPAKAGMSKAMKTGLVVAGVIAFIGVAMVIGKMGTKKAAA